MRSKKMLLTGVLALVLAGFAWASNPESSPSCPFGTGPSAILQKLAGLNLTDDQKTAIAGLLKDNRTDVQATLKFYMAARENQFKAVHSDVFDEQAVRDACQVTAQYEEELAVVRARVVSQIKQVLTPEQKEMLKETKMAMKERITSRLETARAMVDSWIEAHSAK
jgi:Spy/CpxP family protein refolding chaperone